MIHTFKSTIAQHLGIFEAVLLNYVHYRQIQNEHKNLKEVFIDEEFWMFTTYDKLVATYSYIEPQRVGQTIDQLVSAGYLKRKMIGPRVFLAVDKKYHELIEKTELKK